MVPEEIVYLMALSHILANSKPGGEPELFGENATETKVVKPVLFRYERIGILYIPADLLEEHMIYRVENNKIHYKLVTTGLGDVLEVGRDPVKQLFLSELVGCPKPRSLEVTIKKQTNFTAKYIVNKPPIEEIHVLFFGDRVFIGVKKGFEPLAYYPLNYIGDVVTRDSSVLMAVKHILEEAGKVKGVGKAMKEIFSLL